MIKLAGARNQSGFVVGTDVVGLAVDGVAVVGLGVAGNGVVATARNPYDASIVQPNRSAA
jgi:hypothetical protein